MIKFQEMVQFGLVQNVTKLCIFLAVLINYFGLPLTTLSEISKIPMLSVFVNILYSFSSITTWYGPPKCHAN